MSLRDVFAAFRVTVDQSELIEAQRNVQKLINTFSALQRVATFAMAAIGLGKLADSADEYITLENKLKAVTDGTAEFIAAQKGVERVAEDLAVPVSKIADSFLRYKLATESLNATQEETLDFTKRVTQAMILSGATSEEAHRASIQLAQGFGKNFKAAAQDLKSVKEQAPVLARLIERAVGGTPGTLLQLAHEGKISSKIVFDAVRAAGEQLDRDFAKRQKTFATIGDMMGDVWLQLMKRLKPVFVPIIDALERMVKWTREWVADGSAMNAVIAGAITAVGALTYVFGGLALSVAAAAAPFVALFLALDELVGFIRGD
jgi:tape measure domain-containing protein